jgi:hypothetical protein
MRATFRSIQGAAGPQPLHFGDYGGHAAEDHSALLDVMTIVGTGSGLICGSSNAAAPQPRDREVAIVAAVRMTAARKSRSGGNWYRMAARSCSVRGRSRAIDGATPKAPAAIFPGSRSAHLSPSPRGFSRGGSAISRPHQFQRAAPAGGCASRAQWLELSPARQVPVKPMPTSWPPNTGFHPSLA